MGKTLRTALEHGVRSAMVWAGLGLLAQAALVGCVDPKQDAFVSEGGISPDPTARVEGSILYTGPRPRCNWDVSPPKILGRVVLTLFEYTNPPPPEGTATSALNLLYVNGEDLFLPNDCVPMSEATNQEERITRTAPFAWPRLPLAAAETSYQIRGFYDYDQDMLPFFSVTRLPTEGDVIGAALNDIQDASKGFYRVRVPSFADGENGAVIRSVTVALGNVVRTERPAFKLDVNRKLSAESPFPLPIGTNGFDGTGTLTKMRALTCANGGTDGATCGMTLRRIGEEEKPKLDALDVNLADSEQNPNWDPKKYAFYAEPVDIKTVVKGGADVPVADGVVDPHPFLAGLGIPWYTPMVLLQRIQTPIEVQAGIPRVIMVGSVLMPTPAVTTPPTPVAPEKKSYLEVPVAVPPVGAVELVAGRNECRVPYFPRSSTALVLNGRLAHCSEVPSGYYAVNVLGGVAGGQVADATGAANESTRSVTGGRYSGQSWSIPNELGDPLQTGVENVMPHQSTVDGAFVVYDPDPSNRDARGCEAPDVTLNGQCVTTGPEYDIVEGAPPGIEGADSVACLPRSCCEAVAHLCGVPRCDVTADAAGNVVSASPTTVTTRADGRAVPNCIPFDLPIQCCQ